MLANNNIVSFDAHHATGSKELSPQNKEIIASCRVILANALPKCFIFLSDLDDTLFKLADQAENNLEQSEYFAAMFIFRIKQSDLKNEFTRLILKDFDNFFSTSLNVDFSNTSPKRAFKLSILQNDELEEELAITRITTKSNDLFGNEFSHLSRRFAHLSNQKTITNNPLAANRIAAHLKTVISPITENAVIKIQAYKQFELHTINELKNVYQQLNDELIKYQILSHLTQNRSSQQNSAPSPIAPSPTKNTVDNTSDNPVQPSLSSVATKQQPFPFEQVSITQSGSYQLPELQPFLTEKLPTDAPSFSHADQETITIINLLFEFILEDNSIPSTVRAIIARLQMPMLNIALSDNKFYCTKNHPARRLLNNLAKISTGWHQQKTSQQALIQEKIETIVTTILAEFDTDISLFNRLNFELKQFIKQQNKSSALIEQRIVKENEGQEKLLAVQQEVDNAINARLSPYSHLPKVVISLIDDGLKHLLKLRLLQKGRDSAEWRDAIQLLEQVIWSVTPKLEPMDRKKLLETSPHLLKELANSLAGASFNQLKIKTLLKELQFCHMQCLNGDDLQQNRIQTIESLSDELNSIKQEALPTLAAESKVISDHKALEKATTLKIGTWLEVMESDSPLQMKFSWRSDLTGHSLFVTYHGLKAAELSIGELASLFQQGQAHIIDPTEPLMDRALASIMKSINN